MSPRNLLAPLGAALLLAAACRGAPPAPVVPLPGAEDVSHSLFLIGDAGAPAPGEEPVLIALRDAVGEAPGPSHIVFLGDNIYPYGMPDSFDPSRADAEWRLREQVDVSLETGAPAIFLPGNHDWNKGRADGWDRILRQERFLDGFGRPGIQLLPRGGCPGPVAVPVGDRLLLVVLNTPWFIQGDPRPGPDACPAGTDAAVFDSLRAVVSRRGDRRVVVAAHHPLISTGPHGGHFTWKDHIFPLHEAKPWLLVPLPVIGSLYPMARQWGVSEEDQSNSLQVALRDSLEAAVSEAGWVVFAGGHEHTLEALRLGASRYQLVSGSGIYDHQSPTGRRPETMFAAAEPGFMRLDALRDGRVRLAVITVDGDGRTTEAGSMYLD